MLHVWAHLSHEYLLLLLLLLLSTPRVKAALDTSQSFMGVTAVIRIDLCAVGREAARSDMTNVGQTVQVCSQSAACD